jgi:hypothetical protein
MNDASYTSDNRLRGDGPFLNKQERDMNNEIRELNLSELDEVNGSGLVDVAVGVAANAIYDFMKSHQGISDSINYIKQQAGK